ncbi:primosomal protein N' [Allostreptomyces psammosilenae]|uniref:Probable replication restart protein PriA n=1 Tax=Allostreptomyces psammosilenae TaxID=1892865 RepID=A0A852ZR82_9ACTN|nr:primosomal protein N' [Allostreptomyces psammosilenae]NYI04956.1 primosomal protein N' (replication factor Y) [Allostreptomyces psammosilenae]
MSSEHPPAGGTGRPAGRRPPSEPDRPEPAGQVEQLTLIDPADPAAPAGRRRGRGGRQPGARALAEHLPVARVAVDKPLSHLDQFFDYAVPLAMDADAVPGARVRVRFGARVVEGRREGGRLEDGFIVERLAASDYPGPLAPLASVLSPEPVLTPPLLALCRAVADRYAGTLADVLQLAVPPRRSIPEKEPAADPPPPPAAPEPGTWARYPTGPGYLDALARGGAPRAVWTALPGPHWPEEIARAVAATLASGRGALAVLPDGRQAARVDAALTALLGPGHHVALTAGLGPEERYRRWLACNRGTVRAVVGTRAAMFAPVRDLGLVVVWDDGDSSHSEPHAPQPHAREVLALRATDAGAGMLLGGLSRTVEGAQLVASGWAHPLEPGREAIRRAAPRVRTIEDVDLHRDDAARTARLPHPAWRTAREALASGPVLVQVPRRGYVPRLACGRCREPARCTACAGPLEARAQSGTLHCTWCGRPEADWHCAACGSFRLRASVVGARRTAEELGRAFPRVPVRTSGRDGVLATVPGTPALVVATPGAEPVAEGGYAAALLLDAWALLARPDLRAGEQALRRWLSAAALVRPADSGGVVLIVGDPGLRPVQALVRWDPAGHADRELAERAELRFPPVSRMASVTGTPSAVADVLATLRLPEGADVLGPVPVEPAAGPGGPGGSGGVGGGRPAGRADEALERALVRVPPGHGAALAAALKAAYIGRLLRKEPEPVQIRVDPVDIG